MSSNAKRSLDILETTFDLMIRQPDSASEISFEHNYRQIYLLALGAREDVVRFLVKTAARAALEIKPTDAFRVFSKRLCDIALFADRVVLPTRGFSLRALLCAARATSVVKARARSAAFARWRLHAAHACFKPYGVGFKRAREEFYSSC